MELSTYFDLIISIYIGVFFAVATIQLQLLTLPLDLYQFFTRKLIITQPAVQTKQAVDNSVNCVV